MMESKHSALPWKYTESSPGIAGQVWDADGKSVIELWREQGLRDFDGPFIVHAANNIDRVTAERDELLVALKAAEEFIGNLSGEINCGNVQLPELLGNSLCSYQNQVQSAIWNVEGAK